MGEGVGVGGAEVLLTWPAVYMGGGKQRGRGLWVYHTI